MPLSLYRPFLNLSVGCASALLLFATAMVTKVQADDFGHDIAFAFDLGNKDRSYDSNSDSGKSDHDTVDFSFNNCGDSSGSDSFNFGDGNRDRGSHHDDFFAFTWKDKDGKHDEGKHDSGWSFGDCPPPDNSGCNWNHGGRGDGNGCSGGDSNGGCPNGGDPNGGGSATPEPGAGYLSLIAAGAMAGLLIRRGRRQGATGPRG